MEEDIIRKKASKALGVTFSSSGSFYFLFFSQPNFNYLVSRIKEQVQYDIGEQELFEVMFNVYKTYPPVNVDTSNENVMMIVRTKRGNNKFFEQFYQKKVDEFLQGKEIKPLNRPGFVSHKKELTYNPNIR